jgi:hypothetical protein
MADHRDTSKGISVPWGQSAAIAPRETTGPWAPLTLLILHSAIIQQ